MKPGETITESGRYRMTPPLDIPLLNRHLVSMGIRENLESINGRIEAAVARSHDPSRRVKLIGVSKTFPAARIAEALDAGLARFGENRVQEIASKSEELRGKSIEWHFIGRLQTNKVRKLVELKTELIHSVDRLELAVELERQLEKRGESRNILVEVNTSGESSKSGVSPEETLGFIRSLKTFRTIRVKGLMTIGPLSEDPAIVRKSFVTLSQLFVTAKKEAIEGIEMEELSMGMSGDFEVAIEEGATLVRIGTAIFGERVVPAPRQG